MSFLRLDSGPRQAGMGGVGVGLAEEAYDAAVNPAALARLGGQELGLSHVNWLQDYKYQDMVYGLGTRYGGLGGGHSPAVEEGACDAGLDPPALRHRALPGGPGRKKC